MKLESHWISSVYIALFLHVCFTVRKQLETLTLSYIEHLGKQQTALTKLA